MAFLDWPQADYPDFHLPRQCMVMLLLGVYPIDPAVLSASRTENLGRYVCTWLYRLWAYAVVLLVGVTCLAQSSFFVSAWGDILAVTESGCTILMGTHNLIRLIHMNTHQQQLTTLNRQFVRHIWVSRMKNAKIAATCDQVNMVYKIVSTLMMILIILFVLVPLYELFTAVDTDSKPFPYRMIFPYDANHGVVYAVTYTLTSAAGLFVCLTLFSEDSLVGFYVSHLCAQFRLLHDDIVAMNNTIDVIGVDRVALASRKELMDRLRRIIMQHQMIITFCDNLEQFFSPILLANFTISSMLICVTGFQIAAVRMSIGNLMKLFVFITSALAQLMFLCWTGDKLIEMSCMVADKAYDCDWHLLIENHPRSDSTSSLAARRYNRSFLYGIKFLMQRSQAQLCVTALKFSVLSLKTFAGILSTSMSYFTLLQSLVAKIEE